MIFFENFTRSKVNDIGENNNHLRYLHNRLSKNITVEVNTYRYVLYLIYYLVNIRYSSEDA